MTSETIGRPFCELAGIAADEIADSLTRIEEEEPVPVLESDAVHHRKDGGLIIVALTMSPIRGDAGETVAISITAREITERKQLERRLISSTSRWPGTLCRPGESFGTSPLITACFPRSTSWRPWWSAMTTIRPASCSATT